MSKKTSILFVTALLLGGLVFVDNSALFRSESSIESVPGQTIFRDRLYALRRILGAEAKINHSYRSLAVPYAMQMAELYTFSDGDEFHPQAFTETAIRQLLTPLRGVTIKRLTAGEPRDLGSGVYSVSSAIDLQAITHQGALESIMTLGRTEGGLVWEELDVLADPGKQTIRIMGELLSVAVRSAE